MSLDGLQFNLEKTLIRDGMIFIIGWACHEADAIRRIRLHVEVERGSSQVIDAEMGYLRDDVAARFPGLVSARNAGFIAYGGWGKAALQTVSLEFEFAVAAPRQHAVFPVFQTAGALRGTVKAASLMLAKGRQVLKSRGVKGAWAKVRDYSQSRSKVNTTALAASIAQAHGCGVVWVVDHDMGGGANLYRQQFVQRCLSEGKGVVVLGFQVASLGYFVQFHINGQVNRHAMDTLIEVRQVACQLPLVQLVYNCAVSFRDPVEVAKLLRSLQGEKACSLLVLVHDYFPLCPSHVLLNAQGVFCDLPDRQTCDTCLANHSGGFVSMTNVRDIGLWRREWGGLIAGAQEVQVFSCSSWQLLARVYPAISQAHWRLMPHNLLAQTPTLNLRRGESLHIGIVGTLGAHKGAHVVARLAQEIQRARLTISMTVFGSVQTDMPTPGVNVTGSYAHVDLPGLIEASGANVFLFPSIWPETFSYVAHELCAMGAPLACFELGAQADLVKCYAKGKVLALLESGMLLAELVEFWEESYARKTV